MINLTSCLFVIHPFPPQPKVDGRRGGGGEERVHNPDTKLHTVFFAK